MSKIGSIVILVVFSLVLLSTIQATSSDVSAGLGIDLTVTNNGDSNQDNSNQDTSDDDSDDSDDEEQDNSDSPTVRNVVQPIQSTQTINHQPITLELKKEQVEVEISPGLYISLILNLILLLAIVILLMYIKPKHAT